MKTLILTLTIAITLSGCTAVLDKEKLMTARIMTFETSLNSQNWTLFQDQFRGNSYNFTADFTQTNFNTFTTNRTFTFHDLTFNGTTVSCGETRFESGVGTSELSAVFEMYDNTTDYYIQSYTSNGSIIMQNVVPKK